MENEEEIKIAIPTAFRASIDPEDAKGFALLQKNDEIQKERREQSSQIFADTPRGRERAKAQITVDTLYQQFNNGTLYAEQLETLADAFATLGLYLKAVGVTENGEKAEIFLKYARALVLPDDEWCEHEDSHKFIKDYVFDIETQTERTMLACNVPHCDSWNVTDAPDHLIEASKRRAAVREQTKGMNPAQVKTFLDKSNFKNLR